MKRKFFAAFLSLCMVMSLVPMTALAAPEDGNQAATELPEAVDGVITLDKDYSVSTLNSNVTYDLNGHTLTYTGGTVTISDGDILTFKDSSVSEMARGGTLKLTGVSSTSAALSPEQGGTVNAENINVECTGSAFFPKGDAAAVNITNCDVTASVYCVATNAGSNANYNVEITLKNSTFTANADDDDNCPVMINVPGTLIMDNCTVTGDRMGVLVRAGDATITNCTITATGEYTDNNNYETNDWKSGNEVPMAAVIVGSKNGSYNKNATCEITNTVISQTNTNKPAIYVSSNKSGSYSTQLNISGEETQISGNVVVADGSTTTPAAVVITEGATVTGNIANNSKFSSIAVMDNATLNGEVTKVEGSGPVYVKDNEDSTAVAINNNTNKLYTDLKAAIDAAQSGDTVTLLKHVNVVKDGVQNTSGILKITKDITLDGNSKKITVTGDGTNTPSVINIEENADVTIKNLTINSNGNAKHGLNLYDAGTVTVENVTIQDGTGYGIVCNSSDLTVNGLTTSGNAWGGINIDTSAGNDSNFTMTSGNIQEGNSVCIENGKNQNISAQISGGSFKDVMLQNVDSNVDLDITGGSFNDVKEVTKTGDTTTENPTPSDMITISGGRFANDVTNYLADGLVQDSNGNVEKPYIPPANPNYKITIGAMENGTVTANPTAAKAGATVTLTPVPDEGYALSTLTVTDRFGDAVQVTENADGTYTFPMPNGQVTVTATFVETEEPVDEPFVDVAEGDWFYDAVVYAYQNELMDGVGGNRFAPNSETTRAQLVTILYRLEGQPAVSGDLPFTDVESGTWYTDAILWAAQNNIVNGVNDTEFAPGDDLTRQQLVTILYRYAEAKGYDVSASADLSGYPDADQVQDYAQPAMAWAVAENIIQGMEDGTLKPAGNASRAQIATILMRFCEDVAQ